MNSNKKINMDSIKVISWVTSSGVKTDSKAGELSNVFMERVTSAAWLLLWYGTLKKYTFAFLFFSLWFGRPQSGSALLG